MSLSNKKPIVVSFTGHRKIFDQYYPHKVWHPICKEVIKILEDLKPDLILSGMALGFDTLACDAAICLDIPFSAIVPFKNQEVLWPQKSQAKYNLLLSKAKETIIVSDGGYSSEKMEIRNRYLIDHSDTTIACYDDSKKSGTGNCFRYAKEKNRKVIILDPRKIK